MFQLGQKMFYKAFGLSISSDIYFPELETISHQIESTDIDIRIGDLTSLYFEPNGEPVQFIFNKNYIAFQFSDVATFFIQDGKSITVSPIKEADEDQIRLYILGTCMGVLLIQRRILPLHGSTVAINGRAYSFIGESGAGKSTIASAFLKQGFQLVTDDVIAVELSKDSVPYVKPSYPQQKLWQESLGQFGIETANYSPIYKRETKFVVPVDSQYLTEPIQLAGIFELVKTDSESIEIVPIENLKRIQTLFCHTYRNFIIPELGLMDWHFTYSTKIINHIKMYQIKRPSCRFTAHELVPLIISAINREEKIKC